MNLSPNFTLEELTESQTASRLQLDNSPDKATLEVLKRTARSLERMRTLLGNKPILISSGYRAPAVNRAVGGSLTSAHMLGRAVDFICPGFGTPLAICTHLAAQADFSFDQIIQEGTWVHISFDPRNRRQLLTKSGQGFVGGITKAT